jgi:hypothetical protein
VIASMRSVWITALLLPLVVASVAYACRYTVRDIGFVRLGDPVIQVVLINPDSSPDLIGDALKDLPLEVQSVDAEHAPEHPAVIARTPGTTAVLMDEQGRMLPIKDPLTLGRTPLAMELAAQAATTFAFVMLLEGGSTEDMIVAREEVDRLQARLNAIEEHLPRPLGHPLDIRTLTPQQQARDAPLLWSLGIDLPVQAPTVLIAYGRARRAGEPVVVDRVTRADAAGELIAQLALVGESCECDTSRAWTMEPVGLVPWARDTHSKASSALGFDSESPMVRAEVVRILDRGSNDRPNVENRPDSLEQLLLGYGETSLEPTGPAPNLTRVEAVQDTSAVAPAPVRILEPTDDDDWSFQEPDEGTSKVASEDDTTEPPKVIASTETPSTGRYQPLVYLAVLVAISFIIAFLVVRKAEVRS